jgi:YidC/Oxa1 family membrane protein insertase
MFDAFFEGIAQALNFFYTLVPNYAVAIVLLTLAIMIVLTPFTLKGTKSMIQMQRLQPEMKRLQQKHKDDRQKLNEELLAFYKEHNLNPVGGCLPMLLQAPVFIVLFRVIRGLTHLGKDGTFDPQYLDHTSKLYRALDHARSMDSFGVDLAKSASKAITEGFTTGLPYLVMVAIVAFSAYYQQRQVAGRNPNMEIPPQQKMLMRIFPLMFILFSYTAPAALVCYFVASNLYRIGQQAYITRSLYTGEESLGAQAAKAALDAKADREAAGLPKQGFLEKLTSRPPAPAPSPQPAPSPRPDQSSRPAPTARTTPPNRSRKKKKRR